MTCSFVAHSIHSKRVYIYCLTFLELLSKLFGLFLQHDARQFKTEIVHSGIFALIDLRKNKMAKR